MIYKDRENRRKTEICKKENQQRIRVMPEIFPVSHKDLFNYYFQCLKEEKL